MNDATVYDQLSDVVGEVFGRDDLVLNEATTTADIPGWDSFKQVEVILALEERYTIEFSSREMDGLHSIGDFGRVLAGKLPPASGG